MDDHPLATPPALETVLAAFAPIGLADLGESALLDRVDVKYIVHTDHLTAALVSVSTDYRILEVSGQRLNAYQTLYFDTPDFDIYHQHHNGWSDRYKVRARHYVGSHTAFFEVKHRTNRSRTVKTRLPISEVTTDLNGEAAAFLHAHTPFDSTVLEPKLWNDYQRLTLVSPTSAERVTVDLNVAFGWGEAYHVLDDVAIIEVKQASLSQPSAFKQQMRNLSLRPRAFSKYCAGVYALYQPTKRNNFKAYFRHLDKVTGGAQHVGLY